MLIVVGPCLQLEVRHVIGYRYKHMDSDVECELYGHVSGCVDMCMYVYTLFNDGYKVISPRSVGEPQFRLVLKEAGYHTVPQG